MSTVVRCVRCTQPAPDSVDVMRHPLGEGPLGVAAYCPTCWLVVAR